MPCNTFRMWFLGLIFTTVVSFINAFFFFRQITISIGLVVCALLSLPLGHFMARVLPTHEFSTFGYRWSLNPGPFNIKEHVLIGVMVSVNSQLAYAVDIVVLQKVFYHDEKSFLAGMLLVLTTQITGFALAGSLRRFLVYPAHMVWPSNLMVVSVFRSLHSAADVQEEGRMSRMRYFSIVTFASFVYYWIPGFLFPTIGTLAWICWIAPNNIALAQITGTSGLGVGVITLDWAGATQTVAPMVTPWFANVNIGVGFVLVAYVMVPLAYYSNLWGAKAFPILSGGLYTTAGTPYNKEHVLDPVTHVLVESQYQAYGPLRMTTFFALTYGIGFAGLTATLVHVALFNGREIIQRWRTARLESDDIHSRLMRVYPEVPDWWYGLLGLITFALSMVTCVVYDYMPWWALLLALFIAVIFVLPVAVVAAVTNQQPGLNVVTEYVIGYLLPGHAIANVTFKTYGYIVNSQAVSFVSDLKLGHYMKIPPRIMFMTQLVSAIASGIINLATATWLMHTQKEFCDAKVTNNPYPCRNTKTFYSASVIWGAIGPARVFGGKDGAIYGPAQYGFLAGALLPLITWLLIKKFPNNNFLKNVHWPVLLASTAGMPPNYPYMYSSGLFLAVIFGFYARRYQFNWWSRYNYLTSAALDAGVAITGLFIFFIFNTRNVGAPIWWGNPSGNTLSNHDTQVRTCFLVYGIQTVYSGFCLLETNSFPSLPGSLRLQQHQRNRLLVRSK